MRIGKLGPVGSGSTRKGGEREGLILRCPVSGEFPGRTDCQAGKDKGRGACSSQPGKRDGRLDSNGLGWLLPEEQKRGGGKKNGGPS